MQHQSSATTSEKPPTQRPCPRCPLARPADCPFDPPEELARLREERPLARMVYPDGHVGWLATSHRVVRAVLADPRLVRGYELQHFPFPARPLPNCPRRRPET